MFGWARWGEHFFWVHWYWDGAREARWFSLFALEARRWVQSKKAGPSGRNGPRRGVRCEVRDVRWCRKCGLFQLALASSLGANALVAGSW